MEHDQLITLVRYNIRAIEAVLLVLKEHPSAAVASVSVDGRVDLVASLLGNVIRELKEIEGHTGRTND